MNSMNDERFYELAMKALAGQADDLERGELDSTLAANPERKEQYARLQQECAVARETLPLMDALEADTPEFPTYARQQLQQKVRDTLGSEALRKRTQDESNKVAWLSWRWLLGFATALALILVVVIPAGLKHDELLIQVAVVDPGGGIRGAGTNVVEAFQAAWPKAVVEKLDSAAELKTWEAQHQREAHSPVAQVVYDRPAGEVRVSVRNKEGQTNMTLIVEKNLNATLEEVRKFLDAHRGR